MAANNQAKILIIDDDNVILMQVEQILEKSDYTTICVNNGKEGLEKATTEKPDAIILDRRMPDMDGNETLAQLKINKETQNIPVIMLTGDNQIADISHSFDLGAVDYIVKPLDVDDFLVRLQKALQNKP